MKDYITSDFYYTAYCYSVNGDRIKLGTFCNKFEALRIARQYQNWQIEITTYLTSLPF